MAADFTGGVGYDERSLTESTRNVAVVSNVWIGKTFASRSSSPTVKRSPPLCARRQHGIRFRALEEIHHRSSFNTTVVRCPTTAPYPSPGYPEAPGFVADVRSGPTWRMRWCSWSTRRPAYGAICNGVVVEAEAPSLHGVCNGLTKRNGMTKP